MWNGSKSKGPAATETPGNGVGLFVFAENGGFQDLVFEIGRRPRHDPRRNHLEEKIPVQAIECVELSFRLYLVDVDADRPKHGAAGSVAGTLLDELNSVTHRVVVIGFTTFVVPARVFFILGSHESDDLGLTELKSNEMLVPGSMRKA